MLGSIKKAKEGVVLVEDRDAAQRAGRPFLVVLGERGVDRVQERSDERRFPRGADDGAFVPDVLDWYVLALIQDHRLRSLRRTLIVCDERQNDRQDELPSAQIVQHLR